MLEATAAMGPGGPLFGDDPRPQKSWIHGGWAKVPETTYIYIYDYVYIYVYIYICVYI